MSSHTTYFVHQCPECETETDLDLEISAWGGDWDIEPVGWEACQECGHKMTGKQQDDTWDEMCERAADWLADYRATGGRDI